LAFIGLPLVSTIRTKRSKFSNSESDGFGSVIFVRGLTSFPDNIFPMKSDRQRLALLGLRGLKFLRFADQDHVSAIFNNSHVRFLTAVGVNPNLLTSLQLRFHRKSLGHFLIYRND
jgi:hypothetical protein